MSGPATQDKPAEVKIDRAGVRHGVVVAGRGRRHRQRNREGAGQIGVLLHFKLDDVGVEVFRGGSADHDVEQSAHCVLGPTGMPTRSLAASASGAGALLESQSCQNNVGSLR